MIVNDFLGIGAKDFEDLFDFLGVIGGTNANTISDFEGKVSSGGVENKMIRFFCRVRSCEKSAFFNTRMEGVQARIHFYRQLRGEKLDWQ